MRHYVVRHGHAGDRGAWEGPDDTRPLSDKGRQQAEALVKVLGDAGVERIWSSPSRRCRETVEPLAARLVLPVEDAPQLAEGAGADGVLHLASRTEDVSVMCTHGDVIDALLEHLVAEGIELGPRRRRAKGSTWVLDVRDGRIVDAHYLPAP